MNNMISCIKNLPFIKALRKKTYWRRLINRGRKLSIKAVPPKMDEPIDFVVTWVDGSDPAWRAEKEAYERSIGMQADFSDKGEERYRDWDFFQYWFRAVEKYAPWVRTVYLVTCGQVPEWLDLNAPKLKLVTHSEIMPEDALPTFNSCAIEFHLHKIKGLSEYFVYFNDDIVLTRPVKPEDFFVDGLPNYTAVAQPLRNGNNSTFDHMLFTVNGAINNRFLGDFNRRVECHPEKWFAACYEKQLHYNIYAAKMGYLPGMYFSHLAVPFRKSTFERVWKEFPELLKKTTGHRFRSAQDGMHQLISLWDIMEGNFHPVPMGHYGHSFHKLVNQEQEIIDSIVNETYLSICINDSENISRSQYLTLKASINNAFKKIHPEKSSFESKRVI